LERREKMYRERESEKMSETQTRDEEKCEFFFFFRARVITIREDNEMKGTRPRNEIL